MIDKSKVVLDKLKSIGKSTGTNYQQLLLLLCQEEFLRRLSLSKYSENFVLKGGLFIYILSNFKSRGTVDMDFLLRNQSNELANLRNDIEQIIGIETESSFITFEIIGANQITVDKKYPGVSIRMIGKISNTRTPVNIDFGVGDIIYPKSETRVMKSQLEELGEVQVNTYSLESSMAEKLDAILQRFELTSRMKDFYDIWYVARNFDFDGKSLQQALKETLDNRGTIVNEESIQRIMNLSLNQNMATRWRAYMNKLKLTIGLCDCLVLIKTIYEPVIHSILESGEMKESWNSATQQWKSR